MSLLTDVENVIGGAVNKAVQGVERGAGQAIGGAVHDSLGMPQAMINTFYNFGGFVLGNLLMMIGIIMVTFHLFGDVIRDVVEGAVGDVESVLDDAGAKSTASQTVTKAAGGATIADTVAETAAIL